MAVADDSSSDLHIGNWVLLFLLLMCTVLVWERTLAISLSCFSCDLQVLITTPKHSIQYLTFG